MTDLMERALGTTAMALAFVEAAPDRETAEIAARAAVRRGASADQLVSAWRAWERSQQEE